MVRAGLRAAVELAELAIEETGFGVFEDKVVKNYVATEFLYDYLQDKRSVGVIEEDPERGIVHVAEPIGVVLAITPVTNPTSTVLYKAIVAAKTRNAVALPALAVRRPLRRAGGRDPPRGRRGRRHAARRAAGDPGPGARGHALPVQPPGVDFIWITGGPKIVAPANAAGKPGSRVGPGNAPIYVHRTADVRWRWSTSSSPRPSTPR